MRHFILNKSSRTSSISRAASADITDPDNGSPSDYREVDPSKNALQQIRLPQILPDGTTIDRSSPGVMLPPQLLALFPQLDCGIAWNGGSPIDRSYPTIQFTPINARQGRSIADGRISKPQQKSIALPRKTRREVIDLTEDSSNDLDSNTLQSKTAPKTRCMNGEFSTPRVGEKTVFLLCSLRLDAVFDGPPAVLEEILSLTLQAMGRCGRACLDSSPATRGCTFHVCREINCERNCRR